MFEFERSFESVCVAVCCGDVRAPVRLVVAPVLRLVAVVRTALLIGQIHRHVVTGASLYNASNSV